MSKSTDLANTKNTSLAATAADDTPMGFEDEEAGDMIIPRVKVVQTLSPERKDKTAEEGDIINSLTLEKLNDKVFIPVFKFNNHIWWRDRSSGGGIMCIARDGKNGEMSDGTRLICASCKRCEFDNTKQGREAIPSCTKYINFFGFFEGERMPIILSFAKTNYNEGKKLYSLAKVTMQNMWNYGYKMSAKLLSKGNNEWYIINMAPNGQSSAEDREFANNLYTSFRSSLASMRFDMDDTSTSDDITPAAAADTDKTEY